MSVQLEWMVDPQTTKTEWFFTVDWAPLSEKACKGILSVWEEQLRKSERWRAENGPLMFGPFESVEDLRAGLWAAAELRAWDRALGGSRGDVVHIFHIWDGDGAERILRKADADFSWTDFANPSVPCVREEELIGCFHDHQP